MPSPGAKSCYTKPAILNLSADNEIVVFRSASRGECVERALVLQALNIPGELTRDEVGWCLLVPRAFAERASLELDTFARENTGWPRRARPLVRLAPGVHGVVIYAALLFGLGWCQAHEFLGFDWLQQGRAQARLIINGELWRTATALTLHLDIGHLFGNVFFGALFGLFIGQFVGSGVAWLGILLAGAAGNLANAWLQQPWHSSAGASTAVFAALGMLSAYVWRRRGDFDARWPVRWAPILAGVALLAYTGAGGERTDIGAHLTGFACGLGAGVLCGSVAQSVFRKKSLQALAGAAAITMIAASWLLALSAA